MIDLNQKIILLSTKIRGLINEFSRENFPQLFNISPKELTEKPELMNALCDSVEMTICAIAVEMGFTRRMLVALPSKEIDEMIEHYEKVGAGAYEELLKKKFIDAAEESAEIIDIDKKNELN
jgi:hypothetical protein